MLKWRSSKLGKEKIDEGRYSKIVLETGIAPLTKRPGSGSFLSIYTELKIKKIAN